MELSDALRACLGSRALAQSLREETTQLSSLSTSSDRTL